MMNIGSGIENLTQIQSSEAAGSTRAQQNAPASQSKISGGQTDQASLSPAGALVSRSAASASTSDAADVRLDKVASIQAQLQAGTYNVSASAVAQKVIGALLVPRQ